MAKCNQLTSLLFKRLKHFGVWCVQTRVSATVSDLCWWC